MVGAPHCNDLCYGATGPVEERDSVWARKDRSNICLQGGNTLNLGETASNDGGAMDVSVIIVSYNSADRIGEAIEHHRRSLAGLSGEIIVIDNDSQDESVAIATDLLGSSQVIANQDNVGYGKAANQGIAAASGRSCMIVNDDAHLEPGALESLLEVLYSSPDIGLVGPRIVDEDGGPMPSARKTFPGPAEELEILSWHLRGRDGNLVYPADGDQPTDVAWLVGACVVGDTNKLRELGGFHPVFFLYAEDIDLCRRMKSVGLRSVTVPKAVCVHTGSVSTGAEFGWKASIDRRTKSRDIYYRMWLNKPSRVLVNLRRAIGFKNQPARLRHHMPRIFGDGGSLSRDRMPPALEVATRR